ncbi:hypothetical protein SODALDRAFT_331373 [Sodiomyces alkalinus F11]|uniref:Uncharacterized protein n=1 Tax=Sodiomyces alkalinus (strain CBS 110278 / VKM F-3762 / F11) TaxID=1314773 RepID=A0A3N2Q4S0_SODAK|nr:hypothetical protein SODALDRAFT_331373 [Sodiomyces alkalinus F11]ROT41615.1 hypothetical protein SODALDRAFT_331373 [Sodiomyces alkalinus F11]
MPVNASLKPPTTPVLVLLGHLAPCCIPLAPPLAPPVPVPVPIPIPIPIPSLLRPPFILCSWLTTNLSALHRGGRLGPCLPQPLPFFHLQNNQPPYQRPIQSIIFPRS